MTTIQWILFFLISFCAVLQAMRASYWKTRYLGLHAFVCKIGRERDLEP